MNNTRAMGWPSIALSLITASLLSACAGRAVIYTDTPQIVPANNEVPVATNFPTSTQRKLQAGEHWNLIARDSAKAINESMLRGAVCIPKSNECRPVFVRTPAYLTEFSRAFYNQLKTALVDNGVAVAKRNQPGALEMEIDVHPIKFTPNRPQYRYAGVASELGQGVWALRDVADMEPTDSSLSPSPPLANSEMWFRSQFASGQTPQTEIVVTLSLADARTYLARSTNVYYVADSDTRLYDQEICSIIRPCPQLPSGKLVAPVPVMKVIGDCPLENCRSGGDQ
jgi:hypothetical protein